MAPAIERTESGDSSAETVQRKGSRASVFTEHLDDDFSGERDSVSPRPMSSRTDDRPLSGLSSVENLQRKGSKASAFIEHLDEDFPEARITESSRFAYTNTNDRPMSGTSSSSVEIPERKSSRSSALSGRPDEGFSEGRGRYSPSSLKKDDRCDTATRLKPSRSEESRGRDWTPSGLSARLSSRFSSNRLKAGPEYNSSSSGEEIPAGLFSRFSSSSSTTQSTSSEDHVVENLAANYTVFTHRQRLFIILVIAFTALVSPLSGSLYIPALSKVANELDVSISQINFTVSSYLIFQGLSPMVWSVVADSLGRRQLYLIVLTISCGATLGLAITNSYKVVVVLRALQAVGSASTVALGAGVISDLIHASERGGFMGSFSALAGIGTAFGPVLGGVFAEYTGWHGIFWFLLGLSATMLFLIFLFIPETHRAIVEDGSYPISRIWQPPFRFLLPPPAEVQNDVKSEAPKIKVDILGPLRIMKEPEVLCCTAYVGICFAVWQMHIIAASTQYHREYELTDLQIGLTYIANGAGCLIGSYTTGRLLDFDYKKQMKKEAAVRATDLEKTADGEESDADIPHEVERLEKARIKPLRVPIILYICSVIGFGWSISTESHVAVPIILSFFVGGFQTCLLAGFCKSLYFSL